MMRAACCALLLFAGLSGPQAEAAPGPVDFSLHVERTRTDWRQADATVETRLTRVGVVWAEDLSARLRGALNLGYLHVSQPDNPLTAGLDLNGYYLGAALRTLLLERPGLASHLTLSYRYNWVQEDSGDQEVEIDWHEAAAQLGLSVRLSPAVSLFGAASYGVQDGEQRIREPVRQTVSLSEDRPLGYLAGIDLMTDATGSVGVSVQGGRYRGASIYFRRQF